MDMDSLKSIENRIQIISLIERASLFGGSLWQTLPGTDGRYVTPIIQITLDFKSDKVIYRTPSNIELNPRYPVFIRLNYRSIIFRLMPDEFRLTGDRLICFYPKEVRALDERPGGDRYVLPLSSEISLSVKRIERSIRELTYEMEMRILDVSEKGFGILISNYNRNYFHKHDHFWLKAVDQTPLRHQILGTVCYIAPKGYYLKRGDVRVGLALNMALSPDTFEYLKKRCHLVLSA